MDYSIPLKVEKNIEVKGKRVGDYIFDEKTDTLYYELNYPFMPTKFAVKGLKEITATPAMMKLWTMFKYHNMDWLRQQLMQIKCVENDAVLLHGAAWCNRWGVACLAVGFPNSGKTSIVLREMQKGTLFVADENVIVTQNRRILPVKRRTSLNPWIAKEINYPLTFKQKVAFVKAKIMAKLLPIYEPNIWVDLPYERCSFMLDKIIYLTPGKNQSLALLTDNEFPFFTNPVIQTYAYATGFDLDGIYKKYRGLLDAISSNTECA